MYNRYADVATAVDALEDVVTRRLFLQQRFRGRRPET
jgi:kynureninase